MNKLYQIVGVGNPLMDIEINLSEADFKSLGLVKKSMTLLSAKAREKTLEKFNHIEKKYSSGGSAANTLYDINQVAKNKFNLGMIGFLANDRLGKIYLANLKKNQIDFLCSPLDRASNQSGTSVILITPDGERTMRTTLGCASELIREKINFEIIKQTEILYLEGYLFSSPNNIKVLDEMINLAKKNQVKLAFTASDAFCVSNQVDIFLKLFEEADIFFANQEEALGLLGYDRDEKKDLKDIVDQLIRKYPAKTKTALRVITGGSSGAYLIQEKNKLFVPAKKVTLVDTTGAGDAYAAGILYASLEKKSLSKMGELATQLATKVITKYGARI